MKTKGEIITGITTSSLYKAIIMLSGQTLKKHHSKNNHPANYNYYYSQPLTGDSPTIRSCRIAKREGTIPYGYMKRGTHPRVFSQTLAHRNSKNEIRERKDEEGN